ncbi:general secretion pathway protein GspN [Vibrio sp. 10N.286.49.B3]|uniref:type II secretion system protein N n=1 Tax=Vibrio sp. 10N.286.49.B3 TaxID=1880855 RepID=UPI000C817AF3|nr:type II secretion system protein N [Vibrio sp. 10N.286.49.B3]PMH46026.1 general secretion pathway protein GspN [Vibrio sp. 10N.286.49.B3]
MKKGILYGVIFTLFFSASFLLHTPAAFVLQHTPQVRGLSIEGVQGTIWQGSAQQVGWQQPRMQALNFGQVHWDFQWKKLLSGKAEVAVRFGRGSSMDVRGKGLVGYSLAGPYAENVMASLPAQEVMAFVPLPLPLNVEGKLDLTINALHYAQPWCETAQGSLAWTQSAVGTPLGDLEFGPVIADLACQDSRLTAVGQQESPQVSSAFDAALSPDMRYTSTAWFKPGAEFPSQLGSQLKWLGEPDNEGKYSFTQQGRL